MKPSAERLAAERRRLPGQGHEGGLEGVVGLRSLADLRKRKCPATSLDLEIDDLGSGVDLDL
jgi:hypothetical protein